MCSAPRQSRCPVPEAFLDRVRAGQALTRMFTHAAAKEAARVPLAQTPTGFSDETLGADDRPRHFPRPA
jgi:hypothetical protein